MSKPNALGRIVDGPANPNWKGGRISKICEICSISYTVRRTQVKSRFCSLQCVGVSQRKSIKQWTTIEKICAECSKKFAVPKAWQHRHRCCSIPCRDKQHGKRFSGSKNPNWCGGLSRLPYPWDFTKVTSKSVISRDGGKCQNPSCRRIDRRMTAHHINYKKLDCRPINLICLCSSCNSRANFGRERWQKFYEQIMQNKCAT
jgi:hypothetical protein